MESERFFTRAWLEYYEKQAARFFAHTSADPHDACADARVMLLERLAKLDCAILSDAYVRAAFKNALRDIYRTHFGRPRPPEWVRRLGPLWQRIFELFCLQRLPAATIAETLARFAPENHEPHARRAAMDSLTQHAVDRLREERACPEKAPPEVSLDAGQGGDDDHPGRIEIPDPRDPETEMGEAQVSALIAALVQSGDPASHGTEHLSRSVHAAWKVLAQDIALNDDERILLRLVYQEGLTVADAARTLGRAQHHVRRPIQRALKRIHAALEARGIRLEDLLQ